MKLWESTKWKSIYKDCITKKREGLRVVYDQTIDDSLKIECKLFINWIRKNYIFPIRVPIYIRDKKMLLCIDGDFAYGTFFEPISHNTEPYIRIAAGNFQEMCFSWGYENALFAILSDIAHELTHYYQWINGIQSTQEKKERQAKYYAKRIIDAYATIWERRL